MHADSRATRTPIAAREPAARRAAAPTRGRAAIVSAGQRDDVVQAIWPDGEGACSYDLFDLQDSGLVAA